MRSSVASNPSAAAGGRDLRMPGLLVICFAAQLTCALLVIPPWQNPDEPQHVLAARLILAYGPNFTAAVDRDDAGERAIVASMARENWWRHYGERTPDPVPATFDDGPARLVKDAFVAPSGSRLYYRGVAVLFGLAGIESVVSQMYAMRFLSAMAAIATIGCVWAATRLWLGTYSALAVGLLMVLHPQFVIASTTASPDAAANLAGALVWWNSVRLLKRGAAFSPLLLLWCAAIAGFLIRRMAAPLLLCALIVTLIVLVREFRSGRVRPQVRRFVYALGAVFAAAAAAWVAAPDDLDVRTMSWRSSTVVDVLSGVQAIRFNPTLAARNIVDRLDLLPEFGAGLFRSFWLSAGWVRYAAPATWYMGLAVLMCGAVAGFLRPRRRFPLDVVLVTAAVFVLLQLTAVVIYYFGIMKAGAQGRYLFPVLPAALSLVWIGWSRWFPPERQTVAALVPAAILAGFNAAAWIVVLSAYV